MRSITSKASPASTSWRHVRDGGRSVFRAMLRRAVASAGVLWSTLVDRASPRRRRRARRTRRCRRTRRAPGRRRSSWPTRDRFSRWSRKCPVFWPCTTSATNSRPSSRNGTGSSGSSPTRPRRRRRRRRPVAAASRRTTADGRSAAARAPTTASNVRQPGGGVDLHDVRVVVAVDDEAGQPVVLAVHDSGTRSSGRTRPAVAGCSNGGADPVVRPERLVDRRRIARGGGCGRGAVTSGRTARWRRSADRRRTRRPGHRARRRG